LNCEACPVLWHQRQQASLRWPSLRAGAAAPRGALCSQASLARHLPWCLPCPLLCLASEVQRRVRLSRQSCWRVWRGRTRSEETAPCRSTCSGCTRAQEARCKSPAATAGPIRPPPEPSGPPVSRGERQAATAPPRATRRTRHRARTRRLRGFRVLERARPRPRSRPRRCRAARRAGGETCRRTRRRQTPCRTLPGLAARRRRPCWPATTGQRSLEPSISRGGAHPLHPLAC